MPQFIRRTAINFGKTDAKSAMVTRDQKAKQLFLDAFALPDTIDLDAIENGDRYLFFGTKGSGKTALLRYVMEEEKRKNNPTKFIVFSEDITQQEFDKIAEGVDLESVAKPDIGTQINVRDMWKIFLIKNICDILGDSGTLFDGHEKSKRLKDLIFDIFEGNDKGILEKISKKIKNGSFRFKAAIKEYAEFETIINFENEDGTVEINYSRFAETVIEAICNFSYPEDVKYCLFVDELNLSMLQQKQHKKDSILIRDLILSIGQLNRVFVERNVPIFIYAAVRVEIAKAISVSRNEIDKYLVDHGQRMQWHAGFDVNKYPIFEVIEQRITALETQASGHNNTRKEVWDEYFARDVFGVSPKKFISEVTWCNPRDIVNLFNLTAGSHLNRPMYDTSVFAAVAEQYSEIVWSERAEELNAEHSMTVVNQIRKLLSNFRRHFKIDHLDKHAKAIGQANQLMRQVQQTVGIEKICRDLYHVGVLGQSVTVNQGKRNSVGDTVSDLHETWFYRDNREFDSANYLDVHRGLYPCLKLGAWRADIFDRDPRARVVP